MFPPRLPSVNLSKPWNKWLLQEELGELLVFISNFWGRKSLGSFSLVNETFEGRQSLPHPTVQTLRGAFKQCRETRVSSPSSSSTPPSRPAAVLAWGAAWVFHFPGSLADRRGTLTAGLHGLPRLNTRWTVSFLTFAKYGHKAAVSGVWNAELLTKVCWSSPSADADPVHPYGATRMVSWTRLSPPWATTRMVCEGKRDCQGDAKLLTRTEEALVCARSWEYLLLSFFQSTPGFLGILPFVLMFSTLIYFSICPNLPHPWMFHLSSFKWYLFSSFW